MVINENENSKKKIVKPTKRNTSIHKYVEEILAIKECYFPINLEKVRPLYIWLSYSKHKS